MDFALTESQELIKKEVGALARTFSLDYWLEKDDKAEYPSDFVKAFADNGWLGITIPGRYLRFIASVPYFTSGVGGNT